MSTRAPVGIERTILCATRFWSFDAPSRGPTLPTLSRGVRSVVRKQGYSGPEVEKAMRRLEREGFISRGGRGGARTVALTAKGGRVGCAGVSLSPWTDPQYSGSRLRGT